MGVNRIGKDGIPKDGSVRGGYPPRTPERVDHIDGIGAVLDADTYLPASLKIDQSHRAPSLAFPLVRT